MIKFKTLLCLAALGTLMATEARADVYIVPMSFGDGLTQTGNFDITYADAGLFADELLFNGPPGFSTADFLGSAVGLAFTSLTFSYYGSDLLSLNLQQTSSSFVASSVGLLESAMYALSITGVADAGGSYQVDSTWNAVDAVDPSAVPEPATNALVLTGLGVLGGYARWTRRRSV